MTLQFSIALFTGMVAATLLPPVRRVVPRPLEAALWAVLVVVCVIGVLSITNPNARELTASAFWGVDQVVTTLFSLLGAGVVVWLVDHRFTIASGLLIASCLDIFALALLRSYRKRHGWQPRVRLHEWMELPPVAVPATQPVPAPYALDGSNRRWAGALAMAGAALLTWFLNFSIWARDVLLPRQAQQLTRAAAVGRVESRARLESLRDRASQLQFAAHGWYVAAGEPAVSGLATRATEAARTIGRAAEGSELRPGRMVDIRVLLSAKSLGYGPMRATPAVHAEEEDEDDSQQTGRLAS